MIQVKNYGSVLTTAENLRIMKEKEEEKWAPE